MTFEQAFLKIKQKFDNTDTKGIADFAIQITFTDEDCGGTFYAELKNGALAVEPYDYKDNNAVLNISKSALLAFLGGRSSLEKVIEKGDAVVYGDASKIADLKATIKEAPAKKTAAKKTTAKKAPAKKTTAKKTTTKKAAAPKKTAETKKAAEKAPAKSEAKAAAPAAVAATASTSTATAKPAATAAKNTTKK